MTNKRVTAGRKTSVGLRWLYRLQTGAVAGIVALLLISGPQVPPTSAAVTLDEAARQLMEATIQSDATALKKWFVAGQEFYCRDWQTSQINFALSLPPAGRGKPVVRIARVEQPLTWIEVQLVQGKGDGEVMHQAWRQDQQGHWRFDCRATMERFARQREEEMKQLDPPDMPLLPAEPLLLL